MSVRRPLPLSLQRTPFRVGAALDAGVAPGRLRAHDLGVPVWGVRTATEVLDTFALRCIAFQSRLGVDSVVSHGTAAHFWGFQLPTPDVIHLSKRAPARAPHARGIHGHSLDLAADEVTRLSDIRLTTPARTWLDLASTGASLDDLIVAGDRLVWWRRRLETRTTLEQMIARHPRARGVRLLRASLDELTEASDSQRETRLRLRIIARGLPRPAPRYPVRDRRGFVVAHGDLAFPEFRTLLEYEGDHHRTDRGQWGIDLDRFNTYQRLGWASIRIGAPQFRHLDRTIDLIGETLRSRGWHG